MDEAARKKKVIGARDPVVDGIRTRILDAGSGDPLVLIHGLGGPLMWQRVTGPLAERRRIVQIDLPGFGDSAPPLRAYGPEEYALHIIHTLDTLHIPSADIAGISYGGQIAATVAARHPERVRRLVLICSTGLMKEPRIARTNLLWRVFAHLVKYTVLRNKKMMCRLGSRSFYSIASRPADLCERFYEQLSRPGARDAWLNAFRHTFSGREQFLRMLRDIKAPALIVWGECDMTVSPSLAWEFQSVIAEARVVMFGECAHSAPLERGGEVCGAMEEFLES